MKKNLYILIAVLAVLVIAAIILMNNSGEKTTTIADREVFIKADSSSIDKIEIKCSNGYFILAKAKNGWQVIKPIKAKADNDFVSGIAGFFAHSKVKNISSDNPAKFKLYEVDTSATRVKVYSAGKLEADFYVGKAGISYDETFLRYANSNQVALVDGPFSFMMNSPLKNWRDKIIIKAPIKDISQVDFQYTEGGSFKLALAGNQWNIDGKPVDSTAVSTYINNISELFADDFIDSVFTAEPVTTGLVSFAGRQIRFAKTPGDDSRFLVRSSEFPQWYVMSKNRAESVLIKKDNFDNKKEDK